MTEATTLSEAIAQLTRVSGNVSTLASRIERLRTLQAQLEADKVDTTLEIYNVQNDIEESLTLTAADTMPFVSRAIQEAANDLTEARLTLNTLAAQVATLAQEEQP